MGQLCIEDGFEHNIRRAIEDVARNYEDPDELDEFLSQVDGGIDMANALYERAYEYMDLVEIANEIWKNKK